MQIIRTREALSQAIDSLKAKGKRIALVPTMGALHAGHLSLVETAKARADAVVASIFVNPAQFAPHEDFDRYPRDEAGDLALLAGVGVEVVYLPGVGEVYPEGRGQRAESNQPAGSLLSALCSRTTALEAESRPHFLPGVMRVVGILFDQVRPEVAVFGEKDYQQLCVIRTMVKTENRPIEVVGSPTLRERDGLAMSSRNQYLSAKERAIAPALYHALTTVAEGFRKGGMPEKLKSGAWETLLTHGFREVDYVAIRHAETLNPVQNPEEPARVLAAAWLGNTRLIDNVAV